MQMTITSTTTLTTVNGSPCRIWHGRLPNGARCLLFVPAIAVAADEDQQPFAEGLIDLQPPVESVPLSKVAPSLDRIDQMERRHT